MPDDTKELLGFVRVFRRTLILVAVVAALVAIGWLVVTQKRKADVRSEAQEKRHADALVQYHKSLFEVEKLEDQIETMDYVRKMQDRVNNPEGRAEYVAGKKEAQDKIAKLQADMDRMKEEGGLTDAETKRPVK